MPAGIDRAQYQWLKEYMDGGPGDGDRVLPQGGIRYLLEEEKWNQWDASHVVLTNKAFESMFETSLKEAFTCNYIDPSGLLTWFLGCIMYLCSAYKKGAGQWFSPYTCLVQSSGTGKSKLVYELAKVIPVLYVCFRKKGAVGYPSRSDMSELLMEVVNDHTYEARVALIFTSLFLAGLKKLCELMKTHSYEEACVQLSQSFLSPSFVDVIELEAAYLSLYDQWSEYSKTNQTSVALEEFIRARAALFMAENLETILVLSPLVAGCPLLTVVFDEARSMLDDGSTRHVSTFRVCRRVMAYFGTMTRIQSIVRYLPPGSPVAAKLQEHGRLELPLPILGIMIDTNSTITNFMPVSVDDPSLRRVAQKLLPVITLCGTVGVFRTTFSTVPTFRQLYDVDYLLSSSRPMFAVLRGTPEDHEILIPLAEKKLFDYDDQEPPRIKDTKANMFTLLGHLIGLEPNPSCSLVKDLVARHMLHLLGVSEDRTDAYGFFSSEEPVLVEACFSALRKWCAETRDINAILGRLRTMLTRRFVQVGEVGELIFRLLMCLCWADLCRKDPVVEPELCLVEQSPFKHYRCFTARTYLSRLLGSAFEASREVYDSDARQDGELRRLYGRFLGGFVRCASFVKVCVLILSGVVRLHGLTGLL